MRVSGPLVEHHLVQLAHIVQACSSGDPGVVRRSARLSDLAQSQLANAINRAEGDGQAVQLAVFGVTPALLLACSPTIQVIPTLGTTTKQQIVLILVSDDRLILGVVEDGSPTVFPPRAMSRWRYSRTSTGWPARLSAVNRLSKTSWSKSTASSIVSTTPRRSIRGCHIRNQRVLGIAE